MGIEQGRGEQYDPAEIAIGEQQGPIDLAHEAAIRRMYRGKTPIPEPFVENSSFPEVSGRTRSGIDAAILAEELQYTGVEPVSVDAPIIKTLGVANHDLEEGSGWE